MIRQVGRGLLYDDRYDRLGELLGSTIGTRVVDTEAARLAKKNVGLESANEGSGESMNGGDMQLSQFRNALAGIGTPSPSIVSDGDMDFSGENKSTPRTLSVPTADFVNRLYKPSESLSNPDSDYNLRKWFTDKNKMRPNAFTSLQ